MPWGLALCAACSDGMSPAASGVARVAVFAQRDTLVVGDSVELVAELRDRDGAPISGTAPSWRSTQPAVASLRVNPTPVVATLTAVSPGQSVVEVASGRASARKAITVLSASAIDVALVDAQWTQAIQSPDGSIPMVLNGNAAVLNVVIRTTAVGRDVGDLVLTLSDSLGRALYRDTVRAVPFVPIGSLGEPSVQFLVPARALRPGLFWRVVRDPEGRAPDRDRLNDALPASGPGTLRTVALPPMHVRFVPVVLVRHDSLRAFVQPSAIDGLMIDVRRLLPWSDLTVSIAPPMTTTALFGTPPLGGSRGFFQQLMVEVEALRVNDSGHRDAYWIAVSPLPRGYSRLESGGSATIPRTPVAGGSASVLQLPSDPGYTSRAIAHEIGHLLGRDHAPCGNPPEPDLQFPSRNALIEAYGYDVFGWASGSSFSATPKLPTSTDLMSYCLPIWVSAYTYTAMIAARQAAVPTTAIASEPVVVVSGVVDGSELQLSSIVTSHAAATPRQFSNATIDLFDVNGRVIANRRVTLRRIDHSPGQLFTAAIPMSVPDSRAVAGVALRTDAGLRMRRFSRIATPDAIR
jgi:hypothetical protein